MVSYGMVLPHRSTSTLDPDLVAAVAQRAEVLGFRDLWVTENTLDRHFSFDPLIVLTYAAAVTTTIRLGVAVVVLPMHHPAHVAHQVASLDRLSRGRALLAVGLGRAEHYAEFEVPTERRVRRLIEGVQAVRALWAGERATLDGEIYRLHDASLGARPVQDPMPLWMGGEHPDALRRAARYADGWIGGGGGGGRDEFAGQVAILKGALEAAGRDPDRFPISKRLFMAVGRDRRVARAMLDDWFGPVYGDVGKTETHGVFGTVDEVREQVAGFVAAGATHLLLNPVSRFDEQVELAHEVVGPLAVPARGTMFRKWPEGDG